MSDYTPTTEEVSIGWAWYKSGWIHSDEIQPQFDRWLAEITKAERERIRANIIDRVQDLTSCNKTDNCQEFGELIASYIEEWIDGETE